MLTFSSSAATNRTTFINLLRLLRAQCSVALQFWANSRSRWSCFVVTASSDSVFLCCCGCCYSCASHSTLSSLSYLFNNWTTSRCSATPLLIRVCKCFCCCVISDFVYYTLRGDNTWVRVRLFALYCAMTYWKGRVYLPTGRVELIHDHSCVPYRPRFNWAQQVEQIKEPPLTRVTLLVTVTKGVAGEEI